MKPGPNPRRTRSRNGKRFPPSRNQTLESNGPEVKIRGTAQQVLEKYLSLAQDATSSGDRVNAEAYLQHAEHYFRMIHLEGDANGFRRRDERPGRTPESIGNDDSATLVGGGDTDGEADVSGLIADAPMPDEGEDAQGAGEPLEERTPA